MNNSDNQEILRLINESNLLMQEAQKLNRQFAKLSFPEQAALRDSVNKLYFQIDKINASKKQYYRPKVINEALSTVNRLNSLSHSVRTRFSAALSAEKQKQRERISKGEDISPYFNEEDLASSSSLVGWVGSSQISPRVQKFIDSTDELCSVLKQKTISAESKPLKSTKKSLAEQKVGTKPQQSAEEWVEQSLAKGGEKARLAKQWLKNHQRMVKAKQRLSNPGTSASKAAGAFMDPADAEKIRRRNEQAAERAKVFAEHKRNAQIAKAEREELAKQNTPEAKAIKKIVSGRPISDSEFQLILDKIYKGETSPEYVRVRHETPAKTYKDRRTGKFITQSEQTWIDTYVAAYDSNAEKTARKPSRYRSLYDVIKKHDAAGFDELYYNADQATKQKMLEFLFNTTSWRESKDPDSLPSYIDAKRRVYKPDKNKEGFYIGPNGKSYTKNTLPTGGYWTSGKGITRWYAESDGLYTRQEPFAQLLRDKYVSEAQKFKGFDPHTESFNPGKIASDLLADFYDPPKIERFSKEDLRRKEEKQRSDMRNAWKDFFQTVRDVNAAFDAPASKGSSQSYLQSLIAQYTGATDPKVKSEILKQITTPWSDVKLRQKQIADASAQDLNVEVQSEFETMSGFFNKQLTPDAEILGRAEDEVSGAVNKFLSKVSSEGAPAEMINQLRAFLNGDRRSDAENEMQVVNRLARLYHAASFYEQVLWPYYEQTNKKLPEELHLSVQDFMSRFLTPSQYSEYQASTKFREYYDKMSGKTGSFSDASAMNFDTGRFLKLLGKRGLDFLGNNAELANLSKAMQITDGHYSDDALNEFFRQLDQNRKTRFWEEHGYESLILKGEPIAEALINREGESRIVSEYAEELVGDTLNKKHQKENSEMKQLLLRFEKQIRSVPSVMGKIGPSQDAAQLLNNYDKLDSVQMALYYWNEILPYLNQSNINEQSLYEALDKRKLNLMLQSGLPKAKNDDLLLAMDSLYEINEVGLVPRLMLETLAKQSESGVNQEEQFIQQNNAIADTAASLDAIVKKDAQVQQEILEKKQEQLKADEETLKAEEQVTEHKEEQAKAKKLDITEPTMLNGADYYHFDENGQYTGATVRVKKPRKPRESKPIDPITHVISNDIQNDILTEIQGIHDDTNILAKGKGTLAGGHYQDIRTKDEKEKEDEGSVKRPDIVETEQEKIAEAMRLLGLELKIEKNVASLRRSGASPEQLAVLEQELDEQYVDSIHSLRLAEENAMEPDTRAAYLQKKAKMDDAAGIDRSVSEIRDELAAQKKSRKEEIADEKLYNQLLEQRLQYQKKLINYQRQLDVSGDPMHKQALRTVIGYYEGQIGDVSQQITNFNNNPENHMSAAAKKKLDDVYANRLIEALAEGGAKQKGARNFWDKMVQDIGASFRNMFNFSITARSAHALVRDIQKVIQITKQLDEVMVNIRIVTGANVDTAKDLMRTYNALGKEIGATTAEVAASANEWLRQGYTVHDTQKLITASTYLAKLGMMSQSEATKDLTAALKGFKLQAEEAMGVVDELTKLDMNYAASAGQIAEALSRTAAVAQLAGMSMEETAAAVTVIMDVTQQGAEMTGTAMRSMLSRFGQVKAGSFVSIIGDEEDAENINDIEKVLNAIGITIRKNNMEMRAWTDVLADLNEKWITLSDVEKNAIATAMAGTRQRNSFLTLMANYDRFAEAVETAENAQGTAVEKYKAYTDSIEYSVKRLTAAWEEFTQKLSANQALKGFANVAAFLIKHLDSLITHLGTFLMMSNAWRFSGANLKQVFGMGGVATKLSTIMPGQGMKAASGELQVGRGITQLDSDVKTGFSNVLKAMGYDVPDAGGSQNNTGNSKPLKSISKAQLQAKMALVGGATAGLTSAISGAGRFDSLFGVGDVNDTGTDKLVRGVANGVAVGALSAIPGVGPILGATIGPFIGDAISGLIKQQLHSDELTRKTIVEQAEKELKALSETSSAMDEMVNLSKTSSQFWNADEWKSFSDDIAKLRELATDPEGGSGFVKYFGSDNVSKLMELSDVSDEASKQLLAAAKAAALLAEGEAKYNQGIEDRFQLEKTANEARKKNSTNADAAEAAYENSMRSAQKELDEARMYAALYSSGVAQMTAQEMGNASLQGVAYRLVKSWGENGYSGAFINGSVNSAAVKAVEQMLRTQGGYSSLFANATRSYGHIQNMYGSSGYNMARYRALVAGASMKEPTEEWKTAAKEWAKVEEVTDEILQNFRDYLYNIDPARLQDIAHGFGMTQEAFESLGDIINILTEADATGTLEQFTEKLKGFVEVFSGFATGNITQSNIDFLKKHAPELLLNESGQLDVGGTGSRLVRLLSSGGMASAIGGKIASESFTDADMFAAFKETLSPEEQLNLKAYSSFKALYDAGKDTDELREQYAKYVADTTAALDIYDAMQEQAIKLSKHYIQQEIDGLQSIKDSLGEINRMREKEIALMKARDALENAKNEKKRVYREGLGFVYTADSQAISDAQQNLEKLETEQRQEDIQYQIDTLKNQQEILDNIKNNEQLEALQDTFKDFTGDTSFGEFYTFITQALGSENQLGTLQTSIANAIVAQQKAVADADSKSAWESVESKRNQYLAAKTAYESASPREKAQLYEAASTLKRDWEQSFASLKDTAYYKQHQGELAALTTADGLQAYKEPYYLLPNFPVGAGHGKAYMVLSSDIGGELTNKELDQFKTAVGGWKSAYVSYMNPGDGMWTDCETFEDLPTLREGALVYNWNRDRIAMWSNGAFHYVKARNDSDDATSPIHNVQAKYLWNSSSPWDEVNSGGRYYTYAKGSISTPGSKAFINEFGIEGIVTPYGTLTALPAKSGVVPADLTKNLFELGAVAPTLIRRMEQRDILERSGNSSEDNSMSIQNFYAKFETGDGFDFEKLLVQARQYVALSKQNRVNVK